MESITCNEPLAKEGGQGLDKRIFKKCIIRIHSRTNRLADADGRSVKAAIDGLREAGLLEDDNPKFVERVEQSQEITKKAEETILDIVWQD